MKRIIRGIIVMMFAACLYGQTANVKDVVSPKYYDQLVKDGSIKIFHEQTDMSMALIPSSSYKSKVLNERIKKTGKPFLFESLFLLKKDDLRKTSNSNDADLNIDDVSRVLRSISTMQGITYYSNSKKRDRILYDKAYTISGPESKTAIADKNTGNADGKVLYCLLNDASFGITRYKLNYSQKSNEILTTFTTTDAFGLGPITGIEPGDLKINILVIDCGDSFVLYLAPDANVKNIAGIDKKVNESLVARMDSIYKWFIKQF